MIAYNPNAGFSLVSSEEVLHQFLLIQQEGLWEKERAYFELKLHNTSQVFSTMGKNVGWFSSIGCFRIHLFIYYYYSPRFFVLGYFSNYSFLFIFYLSIKTSLHWSDSWLRHKHQLLASMSCLQRVLFFSSLSCVYCVAVRFCVVSFFKGKAVQRRCCLITWMPA